MERQIIADVERQYLRWKKKFPTVWCAGCALGIIMGGIIRAIDSLRLDNDQIALISGIGCTGRMPVYLDFNTLHTTHGRALAFATGLKMARPDLHVLTVMGDGDALAIGGNHFIHACRRNIDLTAIIVNNQIYGMTGGQYSPTTPQGARATTAPYGNLDQPFNITDLAIHAGASFVGRTSAYHTTELPKLVAEAIGHQGFSVIEVVAHCHTNYGKLNQRGSAVDMLQWQKENVIPLARYEKLEPKEREGKLPRGLLFRKEAREYVSAYQEIIEQAMADAAEEGEA
ncbi:MAG: 2-oxoacid:ferredoxin oxidoreductase subunit beta [Chloroflexia bacterium]|nr:2-oxoacid:ferredoxin oxidoreductase subunit beta [Chloroflexia bacterium]